VTLTTSQSAISFSVDNVIPATKQLGECRSYEWVKRMLGSDIEACCDYHGTVIKEASYQSLLAAVYLAFSQHRPLVLSPDAVWITIAQGVAHHMTVHGERLRSRFVPHQGRLDLVFECHDWVEGTPENPWFEAFASWAAQIRDHVGSEIHDSLICDFSTTGVTERAASHIVMMDVFERYFHYVLLGICGIPTVSLEGTPADWERLAEKANGLRKFELDWWLDHLLPICEQFVRASRGDVDLEHWQSICKLQEEYGGDMINGWIAKLFPYLRQFSDGPCTRRNPIFENGSGFQTLVAPPGLSRVPFTWRNARTGSVRRMEAIGGLVGITQDPHSLALRPKVGWAVREAEKMEVLLARLSAEHQTNPPIRSENVSDFGSSPNWLPPDLAKFYNFTDGAKILGVAREMACQIVTAKELERLDWGWIREGLKDNHYPNGHIWYRLARLQDGSWLAINPQPEYPEELRKRYVSDPGHSRWDCLAAICHCTAATLGEPGMNPVVALSFTELLERLLQSPDRSFWLAPHFATHGDAESFTRRK
jgi:Domain of unknown function (DUF4419)